MTQMPFSWVPAVAFYFHPGSCNLILSVTELPVKHFVLINLLVISKSIWGARWWLKNLYNPCPQQSFARKPISVWFYHMNLTVCSILSGTDPYCLITLLAHTHKIFQSKLLECDFQCQSKTLFVYALVRFHIEYQCRRQLSKI